MTTVHHTKLQVGPQVTAAILIFIVLQKSSSPCHPLLEDEEFQSSEDVSCLSDLFLPFRLHLLHLLLHLLLGQLLLVQATASSSWPWRLY